MNQQCNNEDMRIVVKNKRLSREIKIAWPIILKQLRAKDDVIQCVDWS